MMMEVKSLELPGEDVNQEYRIKIVSGEDSNNGSLSSQPHQH